MPTCIPSGSDPSELPRSSGAGQIDPNGGKIADLLTSALIIAGSPVRVRLAVEAKNSASSPEFVGEIWLGEVSELVIQGDFDGFRCPKATLGGFTQDSPDAGSAANEKSLLAAAARVTIRATAGMKTKRRRVFMTDSSRLQLLWLMLARASGAVSEARTPVSERSSILSIARQGVGLKRRMRSENLVSPIQR